MLLVTNKGTKVSCTKCEMPKLNSKTNFFDHFVGTIESEKVKFWFSLKNNSSNLYFNYENTWYRMPIVNKNNLDVFVYLHDAGNPLFRVIC